MLICISFSSILLHLWDPKLSSSVRPVGPRSRSTASSLTVGPTSRPYSSQTSTPNRQTWARTKPWLLRSGVPQQAMPPSRDCSACAQGPLWHSMAWWPEPACCASCNTCPPAPGPGPAGTQSSQISLSFLHPDGCRCTQSPSRKLQVWEYSQCWTKPYILPGMHLNGVCSPHGLW